VGLQERIRRTVQAALEAWPDSAPGSSESAADETSATYAVVAIPTDDWFVYRTIGRSEPRDRDFKSDRDKGRPRAPEQDYVDYVGLSVFGTEDAARENAVRFPKMVARVHLEAGCGFMIARTLADVDEHYTVWGDPEELMARVQRPVSRFDDPR
jgi:hypothetical protein